MPAILTRRAFTLSALAAGLAGCADSARFAETSPAPLPALQSDGDAEIRTGNYMPPHDLRLPGAGPAEIIIDNNTCQLAYLQPAPGNMTLARLYSVGIGREGFTLAPDSRFVIRDKKIWPRWTPPLEMRERELRENGRILPEYMEGGPDNPLGARALYLHKAKGGDSGYRIHGTSEPQTIGTQVSSGCIRLMNEDVIDLYDRVPLGIGVTVIDTRLTRSMKTAAAPLALR